MSSGPRVVQFAVAVVVVAGGSPVARAQAPGDQPVVVVAAPPSASADSVMARRWAVSLAVGDASFAPTGSSDDKTQFGLGKLAVRFRATRHVEVELAVAAGSANDGADLELRSLTAGVRYRIRPGHTWDWYPLVDVGGATISAKDASSVAQSQASRSRFDLGVGAERRFGNLGISAELRLVTLGAPSASAPTTEGPAAMSNLVVPAPAPATSIDRETGGELALGATYYF